MSLWKRGRQYWADFTVDGRRYRKRLGTTNLQVAKQKERQLIEDAGLGGVATHAQGPKRLFEAVDAYIEGKRLHCSPRTIEFEEERLITLKRYFGDVPLTAITAKAIADYQRQRHEAGKANRTINMDVGVLSRVLKSCGRWRALADHVRNLPERQRPVGRALTPEERTRLFEAAAAESRVGARLLRGRRRRQHLDAAGGGQAPPPVRRRSREEARLRPAQQERDEPPRDSPQRVGAHSHRTDGRTRRPARAHRAGTLPLASLPVGAVRSDAADVEVGHGLAGVAGGRRAAPLPLPRPAAHGDHRAGRTRCRRPCAGVHQRPPVAPDAGALLAHPHRREAPGARRPRCRAAR